MANWLEIWFEDRESMLETMRRNLAADIEAGYDVNGHLVRKQIVDIEEYEARFNTDAHRVREMEPAKAKHWCYVDLRRRGAIA